MSLELLRRVAKRCYLGPSATFSLLHVVEALMALEGRRMGRANLARTLQLGIGATRTLIGRLKAMGLIGTDRRGCYLTPKGEGLSRALKRRIAALREVKAGGLATERHSYALLLKGLADRVGTGIRERDEAVRAGASGATTLLYKRGRFAMPLGSEDCEKDHPEPVWGELRRLLKPQDGDAIIISSARAKAAAKRGALAAALHLLGLS